MKLVLSSYYDMLSPNITQVLTAWVDSVPKTYEFKPGTVVVFDESEDVIANSLLINNKMHIRYDKAIADRLKANGEKVDTSKIQGCCGSNSPTFFMDFSRVIKYE